MAKVITSESADQKQLDQRIKELRQTLKALGDKLLTLARQKALEPDVEKKQRLLKEIQTISAEQEPLWAELHQLETQLQTQPQPEETKVIPSEVEEEEATAVEDASLSKPESQAEIKATPPEEPQTREILTVARPTADKNQQAVETSQKEVIQALQAIMGFYAERQDWENAASAASTLSELFLMLGEVSQAIEIAQQSLVFIEHSGEQWQRTRICTALADALHQAGEFTAATDLFQEAQQIHTAQQPELPWLYGLAGFRYCDLLLTQGQYQEVQQRAAQTLELAKARLGPLEMALDNLSLGRAWLLQVIKEQTFEVSETSKVSEFDQTFEVSKTSKVSLVSELEQAQAYLDQAVTGLQEAGMQHELPRALLARAILFRMLHESARAWEDLDAARQIAEQGAMQLSLADYQLEAARLLHTEIEKIRKKYKKVGLRAEKKLWKRFKEHLETAIALVEETDYYRRNHEIEELLGLIQLEAEFETVEGYEEITPAEYQRVYLHPGQLHLADHDHPAIVWTILGSCVSLVFYNKRRRLGAICHAQLPEERFRASGKCSDSCDEPCFDAAPDFNRFKYVTCSIRYMYNQFIERGIPKNEIEVKLFGGSNVIEMETISKTVGDENLEVARKLIKEYKLNLVKESTGGPVGRTLYFHSDTGDVFVKLHRQHDRMLYEPEKQ